MKISSSQLISNLSGVDIPRKGINVLDRDFQTIESNEVSRLWDAWIRFLPASLKEKRPDKFGIVRTFPKWIEECWDCDNHSFDFMTFCCRSNAFTQVRKKGARGGLALGRMSYISTSNGRVGAHAINLFALDHEGKIIFFEPADGQVITLSTMERASSWDVMFI